MAFRESKSAEGRAYLKWLDIERCYRGHREIHRPQGYGRHRRPRPSSYVRTDSRCFGQSADPHHISRDCASSIPLDATGSILEREGGLTKNSCNRNGTERSGAMDAALKMGLWKVEVSIILPEYHFYGFRSLPARSLMPTWWVDMVPWTLVDITRFAAFWQRRFCRLRISSYHCSRNNHPIISFIRTYEQY